MRIVYRELPAKRRFGVELEVTKTLLKNALGCLVKTYEEASSKKHEVRVTPGTRGWSETRRNAYWHVKYDSTCGPKGKYKDYGWEVASYIGCGHRDIKSISGLASWLSDHSVEVNRNCGLHIHIDAEDLSPESMGNLMARWLKVEPHLFHICDARRNGSEYCKPIRDRYGSRLIYYDPTRLRHFWQDMAPYEYHTHNNPEKKYSLNTVGYAMGQIIPHYDRSTIELRMPECQLHTEHVENWIRLILNFVEMCKESSPPFDLAPATSVSEFLSFLGLQESDRFVILDKKLLDTKIWVLNKLITSRLTTRETTLEARRLLEFISDF